MEAKFKFINAITRVLRKIILFNQRETKNIWGYSKYNYILIGDLENFNYNRGIIPKSFMNEFVRIMALELISREIYRKKIKGNVAEVGVYKGDFAKFINAFFPDRDLFLFDTFQGFDKRDLIHDEYNLDLNFADTNIDIVLSKMKYPNKCKIFPGYFPETIPNFNVTYCFVSIDVDLYKPAYAALNYFYPRLESGGYILVHDYNNLPFPGIKKAIYEFEAKFDIKYVPLPDVGGSIIITK